MSDRSLEVEKRSVLLEKQPLYQETPQLLLSQNSNNQFLAQVGVQGWGSLIRLSDTDNAKKWYKLTKRAPSPILKIYIPMDSPSLTYYISSKIFFRSRSVRALERFKVLRKFFFHKNVVYKPQLSNNFFPQKMVFFSNMWFIYHNYYNFTKYIYDFSHIFNISKMWFINHNCQTHTIF